MPKNLKIRMDIVIKAAQLLLSLSILVVLHELGHFIPAKLFKTRVEKFFLFFDVKFALFKKKIGETIYGIGWLPLGGYVKIAGMVDESMDKEQMAQPPQPWEFRSKPTWQRLIIMLGGVTVNVIVGFVIYAMILFTWGKNESHEKDTPHGYYVARTLLPYGFQNGDIPLKVNGKPLEDTQQINKYLLFRKVQNITVKSQDGQIKTLSVPDTIGYELFHKGDMMAFSRFAKTNIDSVLAESPAHKAGLQKGDQIVSIGGEPIHYYQDVSYALANLSQKKNSSIEVIRNGERKSFEIAPIEGKIGIMGGEYIDKSISHRSYSFAEALGRGFGYAYETLSDYVSQFKYVFTKKGATQVGGFGSMAKMFDSEWNWLRFWESTAFISIALAFMNLLPIPALDGGHVVFLLYEMVTRRKPSQKVLENAQVIGLFLVLGLFLFANGNDIYRWLLSKF